MQLAVNLLKSTKEKIADHSQIAKAVRAFWRAYLDRHGEIRVLGLNRPLPLGEIYTAAHFDDKDYIKGHADEKRILEYLNERRISGSKKPKSPTRDGIELCNEQQFLTVLGEPRAGK
ncbi:MAG: hypothetical protein ACI9VS_004244 [Candidatus Binatia bacterium]